MKISLARLREVLKEELERYEGEPVLLPYDTDFLDKLIFVKAESGLAKVFSSTIVDVLNKINFSNVNFNEFYMNEFDFSLLKGVKIDPQNIYVKYMTNVICKGVTFIGNFDGVYLDNVNFEGSIGAKINPFTIRNLTNCKCTDVEFISRNGEQINLNHVRTNGTNFNGSNYEEAIKEEYEFREKVKVAIYGNNKIEY
jgi:uncharacterized protein YjbI with pentapeptide repeats